MYFSDKVYDILTWIAKILLPALATLYVALSNIWGLPYADQVSGTTLAIVLFLGMLLNLSNTQFNKANYVTTNVMPKESLDEKMVPLSVDELEKEYHLKNGYDKKDSG